MLRLRDISKVLMVREPGKTRNDGFSLDKFRFNKTRAIIVSQTEWQICGTCLAAM